MAAISADNLGQQLQLLQAEMDLFNTKFHAAIRENLDGAHGPREMLDRLREAQAMLPVLEKEASTIATEKVRVIESTQRLLLANRDALLRLKFQVPTAEQDDAQPLEDSVLMNEFIDASSRWSEDLDEVNYDPVALGLVEPSLIYEEDETDNALQPQMSGDMNTEAAQVDEDAQEANIKDDHPIPEDTFKAVSTSVRGRASLSAVRTLYEQIADHFHRKPRSPPLSIQKLSKMGIKCVGYTAQCSLQTLRHLKLLKFTRRGITLFKK
jgi:Spindle and kinetochore-associated protein 2/Protein of unknown function (DUF3161)